MSGVVEDHMREEEDKEFRTFLQQLVDTGDLRNSAAEGIAKLVIDKGEDVLSEKQRFVFDRDVVKAYTGTCDECGQRVPWSQAYEYFHSPGRCADCEARYEKFMQE